MDVADEVAVRVGLAGSRGVGEVGREAARGLQAGALADEQDREPASGDGADVVEDPDPGVLHEDRHAEAPAAGHGRGVDSVDDGGAALGERVRREPVPEDQLDVGAAGALLLQQPHRALAEPAAQVRPHEVLPVRSGRRRQADQPVTVGDRAQCGVLGADHGPQCVLGGGVVGPQTQQVVGGVGRPGPGEEDARGRRFAGDRAQGVDRGARAAHRTPADAPSRRSTWSASARLPPANTRACQPANSGAAVRPSTVRAVATSW